MDKIFFKKIVQLNQTTLHSMLEKDNLTIIKQFTEAGVKIFEANFGFAWWKFRDNEEYRLAYKSPTTPYEPIIPRKNGGNNTARVTQEPFFDSNIKAENYDFDISKYMKSYIIIPIHYGEFAYGNLILCYKQKHDFTEEELDLATVLGTTTAQAINTHRLVASEQKAHILSEQKEAHFKALIENSHEVIIHLTMEGKVLYVNPSVEKIFNIKVKDALGKNIGDFIYNTKDRAKTLNYIKRILKNPSVLDRVTEFSYKNKDGSELFLDCTGASMSENENTGEVVINLRDVTERKKLEFAKETEKLLEEEKFKMQSIADVTHELRTPLAIIKGNIDLAAKKLKPIKSIFSAINQEVDHLSNIVSDLAMVTSVGVQLKSRANFEKLNLKEIIQNVANRCSALAHKKSISIQTKGITNTNISGDKFYLEKMFINLIKNSLIYGKKNGHTKIAFKKFKKFVTINIADDGIGIAEEDLPYVFERFFKADKSHTYTENSTGLGLSIVKWITEIHGGTVDVKSIKGKGSVFSVNLPMTPDK